MCFSQSQFAHQIILYSKMKIGNKLSKYINRQMIGKGGFACVYRCQVEGTNQEVAMKSIKIEPDNQGFPSIVLRQISLLKQVEHQNIIKLKEVVVQQERVYLIFEFMKYDLKEYIERLESTEPMDSKLMKKVMRCLLSAIAACHSKNFMHRDIKTSNILIDQAENVKIADFGIARTVCVTNPPYSEQTTTQWYRAPEVLLGSQTYSKPIDIWSLGCVFAEMALKSVAFPGNNEIDQLYQIFRVLGTPNERTWPGFTKLKKYKSSFPVYEAITLKKYINGRLDEDGLDFLQKMLTYDPKERITAEQALLHRYLAANK